MSSLIGNVITTTGSYNFIDGIIVIFTFSFDNDYV